MTRYTIVEDKDGHFRIMALPDGEAMPNNVPLFIDELQEVKEKE